jgi:hypothetical protein
MSVPGSVQRDLKRDSTERDVANLAYALWQKRGAPSDESPEKDWIEAEQQLRGKQTPALTRR